MGDKREGDRESKRIRIAGGHLSQTVGCCDVHFRGETSRSDTHAEGGKRQRRESARGFETVTFSQTHRGINREHLGPGWTGQLLFAGSTLA